MSDLDHLAWKMTVDPHWHNTFCPQLAWTSSLDGKVWIQSLSIAKRVPGRFWPPHATPYDYSHTAYNLY